MDKTQHQRFTELFLTHQNRIYRFICAMVPNGTDVDEIFQQTSLTLWEKWESFDLDREFLPWAFGFARNHACNYVRKQVRRGEKVSLSPELMATLAAEYESRSDELQVRRQALRGCLAKLREDQRRLLEARYNCAASMESVAADAGMSVAAAYKAISRIRKSLRGCVRADIGGPLHVG